MRSPNLGASVVYLVTAALLVTALAANLVWVKNIGIQEDWLMIRPWLGKEPDLLGWLLSLNNGHRTPLPRFVYLCLLWLTDDFRAGAILSQFLMAALALALAGAAAKARGDQLRAIDAVFALGLLHLGHWHNLEWGWQLQFVGTTVLGGLLLCAIVVRSLPDHTASITAAVSVALLPMTGLPGIVIAVGVMPWLGASVWMGWKLERTRLSALVILCAAVFVLAYTALYFVGWSPGWSAGTPWLDRIIEATIEYFALAKGSPYIYALDRAIGALVLALAVYSAILCLIRWIADRADVRALGLANFIGVNCLLGLVIAYSRGVYYDQFLSGSYAVFAVLPFFASLIALQVYGAPRLGRAIVGRVAAAYVLILPMNIIGGFWWRDWYLEGVAKYEADVAAGMTVPDIAERNTSFLLHSCDGCLLPLLRELRDAGVQPYDRLPPG